MPSRLVALHLKVTLLDRWVGYTLRESASGRGSPSRVRASNPRRGSCSPPLTHLSSARGLGGPGWPRVRFRVGAGPEPRQALTSSSC